VPQLPMPPNAAMIFNPGTGDYAGFRIVVTPDGRAIAIDGAGHASTQLQNGIVQKFFNDLAAAGPLQGLSSKPCGSQSADAAGTTVEVNSAMSIDWKGAQTPPLTCATDPRAQRLLLDATEIQHALYVQAFRKRNLLTYGTAYAAASQSVLGYNYNYNSDWKFSFDAFYGGGFSNTPFTNDRFAMEHFSNGMTTVSPFSGAPYSGAPFSGLPYASLPSASPYGSLPTADPYTSSVFNGSPYGGSPFTGVPYSSPFSGSGTVMTSAPP